MPRTRTVRAVRARRLSVLLIVVALLGCRHPVPRERFESLTLALSEDEVESLLGEPEVRYEEMWQYRLARGERGYVAFDQRGRVTAWLREGTPRLRSGLLPITEATYQRLRFGTTSSAVLVLLGDPARRDKERWQYLTRDGYVLTLQVSPEDGLMGKSWVKERSAHVDGGLLPLTEGTLEHLHPGTTERDLVRLLGEPTHRHGDRWQYDSALGSQLTLTVGPRGKLVAKSWQPAQEPQPEDGGPRALPEVELNLSPQ